MEFPYKEFTAYVLPITLWRYRIFGQIYTGKGLVQSDWLEHKVIAATHDVWYLQLNAYTGLRKLVSVETHKGSFSMLHFSQEQDFDFWVLEKKKKKERKRKERRNIRIGLLND